MGDEDLSAGQRIDTYSVGEWARMPSTAEKDGHKLFARCDSKAIPARTHDTASASGATGVVTGQAVHRKAGKSHQASRLSVAGGVVVA